MEKVRPWCGQPSDRGRLKNRNRNSAKSAYLPTQKSYAILATWYRILPNFAEFQKYLEIHKFYWVLKSPGTEFLIYEQRSDRSLMMPIAYCSLSIVLTATDQKPQKSLKRWYYPPSHIAWMSTWCCAISPFWVLLLFLIRRCENYKSTAVLAFIFVVLLSKVCNMSLCHYRKYLRSFRFSRQRLCAT